jgi:hypothetical protein
MTNLTNFRESQYGKRSSKHFQELFVKFIRHSTSYGQTSNFDLLSVGMLESTHLLR